MTELEQEIADHVRNQMIEVVCFGASVCRMIVGEGHYLKNHYYVVKDRLHVGDSTMLWDDPWHRSLTPLEKRDRTGERFDRNVRNFLTDATPLYDWLIQKKLFFNVRHNPNAPMPFIAEVRFDLQKSPDRPCDIKVVIRRSDRSLNDALASACAETGNLIYRMENDL